MTTKKKKHTILDSENHSAILNNLKRTFSRSPTAVSFLRSHRKEQIWFKKDGTQAKKPHVLYTCNHCKKDFNSTQIQLEHVEPVIPINIPAKHLSFDVLIQRLFCDIKGLQILCKTDHKEKSKQENIVRKEWMTKEKYIVYETINRVNYKRYIGVHKCIDFDDGYLGNGTVFKKALKKYGRDNFYRVIIDVYDNAEDALAKERELVTDEVVKSGTYYNVTIDGGDAFEGVEGNKTAIICHQTGIVFNSVSEAAESLCISASSISKALDNPAYAVRNLHFFTKYNYSPDISVSYLETGRSLFCLNNKKKYSSIQDAAAQLGLNYKSLRNALLEKTDDGVYTLRQHYFLYDNEINEEEYIITEKVIFCKELNREFKNGTEAGNFIKHKNPAYAGIMICRAIRTGKKAYKYTWIMKEKKQVFNLEKV